MDAFRAGRLSVRHDLHLGIGFLAATAPPPGRRERRPRRRPAPAARDDGRRPALDHRGGQRAARRAAPRARRARRSRSCRRSRRWPTRTATIAVDLPGFGDSAKPLTARLRRRLLRPLGRRPCSTRSGSSAPTWSATAWAAASRSRSGCAHPERVGRLGLLAPVAGVAARPAVGAAPAPRPAPARRSCSRRRAPSSRPSSAACPGRRRTAGRRPASTSSCASYLTPRGRAAFYAAARDIYLEEPHGRDGFWTRLPELAAAALFVWGRRDRLVPLAFAEHVRRALPAAEHLELDCGHVPQLERPRATHDALKRFLAPGTPR